MPTLDDAAALAMALPDVVEGTSYGKRSWSVGGKMFAWERPFSKADLKRFGDETPPDGDILGVQVADLAEKEAVLAAGTRGIFTIQHFNGYPAVLVHLKKVTKTSLRIAIEDAWLAKAPPATIDAYLATKRKKRSPGV